VRGACKRERGEEKPRTSGARRRGSSPRTARQTQRSKLAGTDLGHPGRSCWSRDELLGRQDLAGRCREDARWKHPRYNHGEAKRRIDFLDQCGLNLANDCLDLPVRGDGFFPNLHGLRLSLANGDVEAHRTLIGRVLNRGS
jgi:hypothetical protein